MNIILKNGDVLKTEENATCMQAAQAISEGLARNAVCARVNGELKDLSHVLKEGDALEIVTLKDRDGLHVYRHTCAHVLAHYRQRRRRSGDHSSLLCAPVRARD